MESIVQENKSAIIRIKQRFLQNFEGFYETFKFPISFLVITALLDAFSTFCFMYVLGVEQELHPMVRNLSELIGPLAGPFLGGALKIFLGLAAIIYIRRFEKPLIWTASLLYAYAFMHNLSVSGAFNILLWDNPARPHEPDACIWLFFLSKFCVLDLKGLSII